MAGTKVVAVKQALIAGLAALSVPSGDLENVAVQYAYKANQTDRERIYTGRAFGEHKPANIKPGRTHRREDMTFELVVVAEQVGGTAEDAEARVVELGTVVEEWVADNRTLSGSVSGLQWIEMEGQVALLSMFNDLGHIAELTYTVAFNAYLD